ncbi:hypothetical protein H105_07073 [Trichophyton soudanense CBS 452.61]|uniref:Uncharacterized protein n=1 Tax=Trichophyton soudanense CBS 452.61 TaxID=1215331 RepID=A0A022XIZ2_TRISD|nr:hypothetical protein H105_07073 [Trichophyton soudanense CBS 452.61]
MELGYRLEIGKDIHRPVESGHSNPLENGLEASLAVAGKCAITGLENETSSVGSHSFDEREQSVPDFISVHSVG